MMYIQKIQLIFENKKYKDLFGESIILTKYENIILKKSEINLYKNMIIEEIEKEYVKRFDDPTKERETNFEVMFTFCECSSINNN